MPTTALIAHRLPWPADWNALFGREGPLLVEVGFGGGHFLVHLAESRPDANILGIEISNPSIRRAEARLRRRGLTNVRLMYGGAVAVFWSLCRPGDVAGVYINFPDPWPKAAHHARRLIRDDFLNLLATRLPLHAPLEIATDHADYQRWIAERLADTPYFDSATASPHVTEDHARPRTKYERQALEAGVVCHYYKYRRNATPCAVAFPVPQELPMPNVLLETPVTTADILERFDVSDGAYGSAHVRLLEVYSAARHPSLMVEVFVSEQPVSQRIGLLIQVRGHGRLLLAPHEIGFPRATEGLHAALRHLADWILALDPAGRLVQDNLAQVS